MTPDKIWRCLPADEDFRLELKAAFQDLAYSSGVRVRELEPAAIPAIEADNHRPAALEVLTRHPI